MTKLDNCYIRLP